MDSAGNRRWRQAVVLGTFTALVVAGLGVMPGTATDMAPASSTGTVAAAQKSGEAPTEDLARAAAEGSGEQIEVTGLRQERREVFANPDGSFTAQEYTQPIRAVRGGKWVPVDDTLVQGADGSLSPKASTVELKFSGGGSEPFARLSKAGREYALSWPVGDLPKPVVEGGTANYREVLPGVDLTVRASAEGFSHYLVVKDAEAAENPDLNQVELGLSLKGLTVQQEVDGALKAVDAAVGGTVFESAQPTMWDSAVPQQGAVPQARAAIKQEVALDAADGGRSAPVGVAVAKGRITLKPDLQLLRGKQTKYPVVIDPTPSTATRTAWTSVMSGMPTERDWKYSGSAGMGKCPTDFNPVSCNGVGVRRLLFTFPLSAYKGKQILGAQFSARVEHVYWADARAEPVDLYRIGGKDYTVTSSSNYSNTKDDWSDYLATSDTKISPTTCSSSANLNISNGELLTETKAAAAGSWSKMSLGLKAKDETSFGGWKRICGNTYLKITYNNPPKQVDTRLMTMSPGGKCVWGSGRRYTDELPELRTEARDPDQTSKSTDQVKMQFKVDWTDKNGKEQSYTYDTGYKAPNAGTVFKYRVTQRPASQPQITQNSVIYWSARAFDGDAWGPWSSEGAAQRCEFMWDSTRPKPSKISSPEYPSDEAWHHGVGTDGNFTITPADKDVREIRYTFDGEAAVVKATSGTTPVKVNWTPTWAGRHWVTVEAFDAAHNSNIIPAQYEFLVTDGKAAVGQWNLADDGDSDTAHDETGRHPAVVGSGVSLGQTSGPGGSADSAAHFDGTANAYLDSSGNLMDTADSFTVSAWVQPTALNRNMAVASQDSTGEPGFVLGYDATDKAWEFSTPDMDVEAMSRWTAKASGTVTTGKWTQLTGVFDAHATGGPRLRIYVDGREAGTAARFTPWSSRRNLQIGRVLAKSGYIDNFQGNMAEVRVFDRVLPAAQVAELGTIKPQRLGYWPLEQATNASSANVQPGGQPLTLRGDAKIYRPADPLFDEAPLVDGGDLQLDGEGDWAATASPVVSAADSYTVAVRAQLTTLDSAESQTVLSLPGKNTDRVAVRYQAATEQWELAVTDADSATAKVTTVTDDQTSPSNDGSGQHLAVVFDSFTHQVRLYVEGQLTATAVGDDSTTWPSSGGLQVGRSAKGGGSDYFAGALDEVRVYSGAVDPIGITRMRQLTGDPDL
jgi:hypothetical protein